MCICARGVESDRLEMEVVAVGHRLQHANERLRESEERYRALFNAAGTAFLVLAPDAPRFTITDVNRSYLRATMTERETLIGQGIFEAFPDNPSDPGATGVRDLKASLCRVLATRRPDTMAVLKYDIRRSDGTFEERHWIPFNTPILNDSGELLGIIHHAQDVTDYIRSRERGTREETERLESEIVAASHRLQRANEQLRENEERQAFLLKLSDALRPLGDPVEIQGEVCRLLATQLGADRVYCVEIDEKQGTARVERDFVRSGASSLAGEHRVSDFAWSVAVLRRGDCHIISDTQNSKLVPPLDRAACAALGIIACASVPLIKEGRLMGALSVTVSRPRVWTESEVRLVPEVGERLWAAVERARVKAAMQESEERYRVLFESIDEGFCVVEVLFDENQAPIDYRFLQANPAFEQQTGLVNSIGRTMQEMVPHHEKYWSEIYGRIALTGEPARFEQEAAALGRWYDVYAFRVGEPEQRRVAILFRDIMERKRTEAALREQQERLRKVEKLAAAGRLAASLAHEINNPLGSITNILYLLETNPDLDESVRGYVAIAASELDRVSRIVKQSLSYYRIDTEPVSLNLGQVTKESLEIYRAKLQKAGIEVEHDVRGESILLGYPNELRQAIDNLLLNALQAMPEGGRLVVSVRDSSEWTHNGNSRRGIRITIADTGCGIPREIRQRIFEPFFTTKSEKGTGLGLWVLQGIVAKHEGRISVRSSDDPVRSGTVVSVFLPALRAAQIRRTRTES